MARPRTPPPELPPRLAWSDFLARFRWKQGEHVSILGATGSGKTFLQNALLPLRQYVLVIATKPTTVPDPTVAALVRSGYVRVTHPPENAALQPRVIVWPRFTGTADQKSQRETIERTTRKAFTQGGWCLAVDEVAYLTRELRLGHEVLNVWQQGRSAGLSMIAASQRPAHIPRDFYGAATHLFFGRIGDSYDRERIRGMGGADSRVVQHAITSLDRYEFLYVHTVTGEMSRTTVSQA